MIIKNKTSYLFINNINNNIQDKAGDTSYGTNVNTNNSFNKNNYPMIKILLFHGVYVHIDYTKN